MCFCNKSVGEDEKSRWERKWGVGGEAGGREGQETHRAADRQDCNAGSRSCCERAEHYLQYMWFYRVHKKSHHGFSAENSFKFIF